MGMSASQARLLSLTTRMTNNEFRAQTITNSKLRLADKSTEASQEYMNALNSQKLVYNFYDDNGEFKQNDLTAGLVYTYSPLKNQYALVNPSGKVLVSSEDAKNFEKSVDLKHFLECYDLFETSDTYGKYQSDMAAYQTELDTYDRDKAKYDADKAKYDADKAEYDAAKKAYMEKYSEDLTEYRNKMLDYQREYQEYLEAKSNPDLYNNFTAILGTSENPQSCYSWGMDSDGCYIHVLAHLLDWEGGDEASKEVYTASNGKTVGLENTDVTYAGMHTMAKSEHFEEISKEMNNPERVCDGDDDFVPAYQNNDQQDRDKKNIIQEAIDAGREPTELELLNSDYLYDAAQKKVVGVKTLKQKAIDLLYMLKNGLMADDQRKNTLINFTDGDMKGISKEEPTLPVEPPYPNIPPFDKELPPVPNPPKQPQKPVYELTLKDKDKSQWYVNLWHMMNGSDTANLVKSIEEHYGEIGSSDMFDETIFVVSNADKNPLRANYEVFDDNLLNNSSWLQFALEHGSVSICQAQYTDPTQDSGKAAEMLPEGVTWKSIAHTSASDFSFVDDEVAITKAEVKYKEALKEIEYKDKKYDQDLKKLDTEHNALESEYESLKSVISKNVERSFKAFS